MKCITIEGLSGVVCHLGRRHEVEIKLNRIVGRDPVKASLFVEDMSLREVVGGWCIP